MHLGRCARLDQPFPRWAGWPEGGDLKRAETGSTITIRPFETGDEAAVLALLEQTLGGGPAGRRPAEFFRWKHLDNPFGTSFMLLAEADGRIIGLRAFMRWRFTVDGRELAAVRAVDTATHPEYQGMGVFSRLTRAALEALAGQADLVFNTPNDASRPGYLKLGWREVGRVPVALRVRRPVAFARGLRRPAARLRARPPVHADPAARVLEREAEVAGLLARLHPSGGRLSTPRDVGYLRWRYGAAPLLDYAGVAEEDTGGLRGVALFRVRPRGGLWETTVAEVLVPDGDRLTARRLLAKVARAAEVDHLTLRAPVLTGAAAGFLPAPGGISFVVKPLRDGLEPDPSTLGAWALSLGDLEVF
jgi:GNAT superfamily N-acetyltransferase